MEEEKFNKIIDLLMKQLNFKNDFSRKFIAKSLKAVQVFDENHTEKGLSNYSEFGAIAILIKMSEKLNKLKQIYKNEIKIDKSEELKIWEDCSVYSLMGELIASDQWK